MTDKLKKILLGIAALAALAMGGSALAGAASNNSTTTTQERNETDDATEASEKGEKGEDDESDEAVTGTTAKRARAAAAAETGGKPGAVERDSEKGATYEVEVTKTGGKKADVRLDDQFKVIAVDEDDESEQDGEHEDAGE